MRLRPEQVRALAKLTIAVCAEDVDCDEWLARVTRFVEIELRGDPVPPELACIRRHVEICRECAEELDALRRALDSDR